VIILPVMIANTVSYLISRWLQPVAFFDMLARQEGIDLPSHEEQRERPATRVEDAMGRPTIPCVRKSQQVSEVRAELSRSGAKFLLVNLQDGRWAFVRGVDLERVPVLDGEQTILSAAVDLSPIPRLYPDLTVDSALRLMGPHAVLPVVSRLKPDELLGTLSLADIHRTYGVGETEQDRVRVKA
jgi:CIC family chloride channel protein